MTVLPSVARWLTGAALAGSAITAAPGASRGQLPLDSLRARYLVRPVPTVSALAPVSRGVPGASASSPTAFGASLGQVFVGAGYQERTRYTNKPDGAVVAGFGLGDPRRYLGAEIAVTSVSTIRQGFMKNGTATVKLHRLLTPTVAIAAGAENALQWGGPDGGQSYYGVLTTVVRPENEDGESLGNEGTLTLSVGAGNGRFRSEDDVRARRQRVSPFGSVALRVLDGASVIADWTGQDLMLAASIVPLRQLPLVITPGVADLTHRAGDGARFVLGVGMGVSLADLRRNVAPGGAR